MSAGYYHGKEQGNCKLVTWNPMGDGLLFENLDIPIFSLTNPSDVDTIIKKVGCVLLAVAILSAAGKKVETGF